MKKIFNLIICIFLFICLTGCEEKKTNNDKNNNVNELEKNDSKENDTEESTKDETDAEDKEYTEYTFGDSLTIKVNDTTTITGNVIENKNSSVIILQNDVVRNSTYDNVSNVISEKKNEWKNAISVDLLNLDVLFNNLKLDLNEESSGYSGNFNEKDSFLYSDNPYWVTSTDNKGASCHYGECNWAIYRPYIEFADKNLNLNARLVIEISKDYIVE